MKILFIITKSNWGGAQKYVFDLAIGLPTDRYEVKVACGGSGELVQRLVKAGIEVLPINSLGRDISVSKDTSSFRELWNLIRKERPDVLHLNSSKVGGIGALVGRILRVRRIIFTAHGWAFNEDRSFLQKITAKFFHWLTIILCHQVVAVSNNTASAFKKWPFVSKKFTVIHNGITANTGYGKKGARLALVEMYPKLKKSLDNSHTILVGTIAELHPVKNLNMAIRAMSQLGKDFIYIVMGEGQERENLEKFISSLKLEDRVFLLGHVPDASQYIKALDVFVLPSRSEALGYVLLEAGLQEAPVIATAVGGIPEIIEDMKTGMLIKPGSSREISHAISFLAEHADIRKQCAIALHDKVKKDFSIEKMIENTEKIYDIKD